MPMPKSADDNRICDALAVFESSFENWPATIRARALVQPAVSVLLSPSQLATLLSRNVSYNRDGRKASANTWKSLWVEPLAFQKLDGTFFFKLGPCSWRERSLVGVQSISLGRFDGLPSMLDNLTDRMAAILESFILLGEGVYLHCFPFLNLDEMIEARFSFSGDKLRLISLKRSRSEIGGQALARCLSGEVLALCRESGLDKALIDVVFLPGSENWHVLEINPIIGTGRRFLSWAHP